MALEYFGDLLALMVPEALVALVSLVSQVALVAIIAPLTLMVLVAAAAQHIAQNNDPK